jgi:HEAT repeat protein
VLRYAAAIIAAVWLCATCSTLAQDLVDAPVEDLLAQEEIRAAVETAIDDYLAATGGGRIDAAIEGIESLERYGERVVPFLANELEQERYETFDFLTYALGMLETPAAEVPLRQAIERAEATPGAAAMARKAWSCWALGLHGSVDALVLVNEGTHRAGEFPMHAQTTVLEAIALQTAPASVEVLLEQLASWGDSEKLRGDRRFVLRALRRLADPRSAAKVIAILDNTEEPALRAQAADALRSVDLPEARAALLKALKDPVPGVRRAAAFALDWMDYPGDADPILDLLETEDDLRTREGLYSVAVSRIQPDGLPRLLAQWNRPDPDDRRHFVRFIARVQDERVLPTLDSALDDPNRFVSMIAVAPFAERGGRVVEDRLLELLEQTPHWTIVLEIAKAAARHGMKRLAPALTARMLEAVQFSKPAAIPGLSAASEQLGRTLVDLRHTPAVNKLRRIREQVQDPMLAEDLERTVDSLELLRKRGKSAAKWAPLLLDERQHRRKLARNRLAELGGDDAIAALIEAYEASEPLDRLGILRELQQMDSPAVRALLRRLLLEQASYRVEREGERKLAAWIARSFGGEEMLGLLEAAVRMREGRDVETLIYAVALGGRKSISLIEDYRLSRLRFLGLPRGYEQEVLDWIVRRIRAGQSIERYDQPPLRLVVR